MPNYEGYSRYRDYWDDFDPQRARKRAEQKQQEQQERDRRLRYGWEPDDYWDWRATDESWLEEFVLSLHNTTVNGWFGYAAAMLITLGFMWSIIALAMLPLFPKEVPMDMGLVILFAVCGTLIAIAVSVCYTTYALRMAQIKERKEIRQMEYDRDLLKQVRAAGGTLTVREVRPS